MVELLQQTFDRTGSTSITEVTEIVAKNDDCNSSRDGNDSPQYLDQQMSIDEGTIGDHDEFSATLQRAQTLLAAGRTLSLFDDVVYSERENNGSTFRSSSSFNAPSEQHPVKHALIVSARDSVGESPRNRHHDSRLDEEEPGEGDTFSNIWAMRTSQRRSSHGSNGSMESLDSSVSVTEPAAVTTLNDFASGGGASREFPCVVDFSVAGQDEDVWKLSRGGNEIGGDREGDEEGSRRHAVDSRPGDSSLQTMSTQSPRRLAVKEQKDRDSRRYNDDDSTSDDEFDHRAYAMTSKPPRRPAQERVVTAVVGNNTTVVDIQGASNLKTSAGLAIIEQELADPSSRRREGEMNVEAFRAGDVDPCLENDHSSLGAAGAEKKKSSVSGVDDIGGSAVPNFFLATGDMEQSMRALSGLGRRQLYLPPVSDVIRALLSPRHLMHRPQ